MKNPARFLLLWTVIPLWLLSANLAPVRASEDSKAEHVAHNRALVEKILSTLEPGQEVVEFGCMSLHVDQLRALGGLDKTGFIMDSGIPEANFFWPNGVVHFTINPPGIEDGTIDADGNVASGRREVIREAMDEWEAVAALSFIEVPFDNPGVVNHIRINDHPTKNNSPVGKWPLPASQTLNITSWDHPLTKWVICHELGHALGLFHEQSRSDRDNYVDIVEENITAGNEFNFDLEMSDNIGEYDFLSVMHYAHNAFGIDGQTTIEPLPAYQEFKFQMGQRNELSDLDAAGMAAKYGPRPQTLTYTYSPEAGFYNDPIEFRIFVLPVFHPGNIRYFYTLDGSEPTEQSQEWFPGDVILISSDTTVKYFAVQEGKSPSEITTAVYTFANGTPMVSTPVITPMGGTYQGTQQITLTTATPGAEIRYNFGGAPPNLGSALYTGPITISNSITLTARAYKPGNNPSDIATANFTITAPTLDIPPTILPPASGLPFQSPLEVSITSPYTDGEIRYTLDGSEPNDATSEVYSALTPILLTQSRTVTAKVFREGSIPSPPAQSSFTVLQRAPTPNVNPNGGTFIGSVEVSLSVPAKSGKIAGVFDDHIYYTLNNSEPENYSEQYTGPFTLGPGNHTIRARIIYPGLEPSLIRSVPITVYSDAPDLDAPTFKPVARDHVNEVEVTIEHFTEGAEIYYTLGVDVAPPDPTTDDTRYEGPFVLEVPDQEGAFYFLRAKAFKKDNDQQITLESELGLKTYNVFKPFGEIFPPTFDPPGNRTFNNPITVTLSASSDPDTGGFLIFRTTNGDTPVVPDPILPGMGNDFDIDLSRDTELKAISYRSIFGESEVTSETYRFQCAAPVIEASPANKQARGPYGSLTILMSSATVGGNTTIRYATGGLEPTASSPQYTGPIALQVGLHVLKAKTFRLNFTDSDTTTASFIVSETPEAPIILLEPMDATVEEFTDHTFIADATGVPAPDYSWYFQSLSATRASRLAGQFEPSLVLFNVRGANAGTYFMVAENEAGSATSEAVTLAVNLVATPTPTNGPTLTLTPTTVANPTGTPTATPTPPFDFDCDDSGTLDSEDLLCLVQRWQEAESAGSPVLEVGLIEFLKNWGTVTK
jgi:hypothetical protein